MMDPPPAIGRWSHLAPYFPLPLVGAAALLAVLILLTPNLLSTGSPSAGSLESQAELLVDRGASEASATHLYLRGLGLARYVTLEIDWARLAGSSPPSNLTGLAWSSRTVSNQSLEAETTTFSSLFAVNATATYVDVSGVSVTYAGLFAFQWISGTLTTTGYDGTSGASPTATSQLPLTLFLVQCPCAGGP